MRLLTILLAGVLTLSAQSIRWGQIRTSETGVFNVKTAPFNAKGDGVTDDTAAIRAALVAGAGKVVYFPPGNNYKVSNLGALGYGLAPAEATTIDCGAGNSISSQAGNYQTRITYTGTDTPLFKVTKDLVAIKGCMLYGPSATAVSGSTAVYSSGDNTPAGTNKASAITLRDLVIGGFYDGVDIRDSDSSYLINVHSAGNNNTGFTARSAQGSWNDVYAINNKGHGFQFIAGTTGKTSPWLTNFGTFNSGGWGLYVTNRLEWIQGMYMNNDSLGEIYINAPGADNGTITTGRLEYAGLNTIGSKAVSGATAATPVEITFTDPHGFPAVPVAQVRCGGINGVPESNGTFNYLWVSATKITLTGTVGTGVYVASGGDFCGLVGADYPFNPDATAIKIAAGSGAVRISDVSIFGAYGNGIDSATNNLKVSNVDISAGVGGDATNLYGVKSTGNFASFSAVQSYSPATFSGSGLSIIGGLYNTGSATIPTVKINATDTTFTGNWVGQAGVANAVEITAGSSLSTGSNSVIGTTLDASTGNVDSRQTGVVTTYAKMIAGQQYYGICSDCKATSASDNTCAAGGTGAFYFLDPAAVWRCIKSTSAPGADGVVTVRKGDDSGSCTITFTKGLYASTTCP